MAGTGAVTGDPFSPANLSPLPTEAVACPLPFGLTAEDLRPALPGCGGRPLVAFVSHAKQGLNGR
jgi:hypothetical protein